MNVYYIGILTVSFGCLIGASCVSTSNNEKNTTTHQDLSNQPDASTSANLNESANQKQKIKNSKLYENIGVLSRSAGLSPLVDKKLSDSDLELRLWGDIGLAEEKVVVIQKSDSKWNATFRMVGREAKASRLSPKMSWEELGHYLKINRVAVPLPFSFDSTDLPPIVDEGVVFLEINQSGKYDFIYYGQATESSDGKAVISICRKIEDEFHVNMGCTVRSVQ